MIGASLYIIVCSARNRLRVRLRRLREPRYLVGAIVGAAYFYFTFFVRMRSRSRASRRVRGDLPLPPAFDALAAAGPSLAGLALFGVAALAWLVPIRSGLLEFSEAEVQFLLTAPVPRRQLLVHRMLRSQLGLLFTSIVAGLVTPSAAGATRVRVSIGMWVLLVTGKLYFAGVSLARARLASSVSRARRVAWAPIAILGAGLAVAAAAIVRAAVAHRPTGVFDTLIVVGDAASAGAARIVLWPFVAVVRPLFSGWPEPYLAALAASLAVLAVTTLWVLESDGAFQDAAFDVAERRATEPPAEKVPYRVGATAWTLKTTGRAETAFAWKAAMQTLRVIDRRTVGRMAASLLMITIAAMAMGRANGFAATLGMFATVGSAFVVLMAPQIVRVDLRQDLRHLEVLKTWPVPPPAVVRGEMLWPGGLLTVVAWTFMAMALALSATIFSSVAVSTRVFGAAAGAVLAPALIFGQLTIHNAVALLLPAWVPQGGQRPRGLDAMGQRLIMLGGTWLLLIVMALPGALAGGILWLAFWRLVGAAALVPAAGACALVIAVEVLLATEALGPLYERLDVMAVERAE